MATLGEVRDRARALLGDPDGDWATDGYLDPFVNQVYGVMIAYLANTCSTLQEKVVILPGGAGAGQLPQGAGTLEPFQKTGGLLAGLVNPLCIEWKNAGQPPEQYVELVRVGKLPNTSPITIGNSSWYGQMAYVVRGNKVYFTPNAQLIDMQITGDFKAGRLVDKDDELLDDRMLEPMAFGASGLTGAERGNQAYVLTYGSEAMNTLDDIAAAMIRQEQRVKTRLGRTNGGRYNSRGNGRYGN